MDANQKNSRGNRGAMHLMLAIGVACAAASGHAKATNFPVSGTITVNGNPGVLPDGGTFGDSSYNATTGDIASGLFTFPQSTTTFHSDTLGVDITVTYQLSQTNASTGQVANDGVAALTQAQLKLKAISAVVGFVPIAFGNTCIFQPINVDLDGTGAASGLDLAQSGFTIPQVGATDCGGYGSQVNSGIAGSSNSIQMQMAGDFTPPPANDTIFANGFESPNRAE
ncbi:MAG: hypothetical protein ABIQ70_06290 [Dokdonella sp.]